MPKTGEKPVLETKNLPSPPEDSLEGPPVFLSGPRARRGQNLNHESQRCLTSAQIMTQYSINGICSLHQFRIYLNIVTAKDYAVADGRHVPVVDVASQLTCSQ